MSKNDIQQLADHATEGLKDDPELRLDVRQELVAHIEDTVEACRAQGKSDDESVSAGLKAFGSATDIAAELVQANRSRMRLRALCRLAMRALVVPASLLVAVWVLGEAYVIGRMSRMVSQLVEQEEVTAAQKSKQLCRDGLPEEAQFIFWGDMSLETKVDRQRSIWERSPTNKMFYGNYITALMSAQSSMDKDDLERIEQEIRRGEELDPDNARYNYLLAGILADLACEIDIRKPEGGEETTTLTVKNRAMLDRAMAEMLKAGEKPFMNTYAGDMMAYRFALLPAETSLIETIGRIGFAAATLLPDVARHMKLAKVSVEYASLLVEEGREEEALPVLEAWYPLSVKSFERPFTLIEVLVAFAVSERGEKCAVILEEMGKGKQAMAMKKRAQAIRAPYLRYRERIKSSDNDIGEIIHKHGSILQSMLLPVIGEDITKEDLAPGRQLEHTLMERGWLSGFIMILLVVMLGAFIISLVLRFVRGGESAPLLLLPSWSQILRVFFFAVILPLGVFFIYTRHTDLAGREYARFMWPRFIAELHLLTVVMLSIAAHQLQRLVNSRCSQIGVETPGVKRYWLIFLFTIVPIGLIVWLAAGARKFALFRGTLARSLLPVLAAIIVVVGVCAHPYLTRRETHFIQNDSVMGIPERGGFTKIEMRLTKRLCKEALDSLAEVERELKQEAL